MPLTGLKTRLKNVFGGLKDARVRRRRAISSFIWRWIPHLRVLLLAIGFAWLLFLPSPRLGRSTYIDENALQPSQVNTYWSWADVHRADRYLGQLENLRDRNASSTERAEFLQREFERVGIQAAVQGYKFTTPSEVISGVNSYGVLSVPRASGTEAMVISASWRSRIGESDLNLRGVATVMALAAYLTRHSHWAKDIIFVIGDSYLEGMHAWLSAYHANVQANLEAEALNLTSGVIWNALNIDYPGHSFSHLGVFHEGLNGRLPNQDLFNSFQIISSHTGLVPVVLYDHLDPRNSDDKSYPPAWLPSSLIANSEVFEFSIRARNIARHMFYQAMGRGSGVHALYHRYRIDAITIFAVPAEGPHGFHSIGKVVESTLRTMNNLLERLHASFFFYVLTTPSTFLKIGHYLPSVIMISVAIFFGGLREWVNTGWRRVSDSPVQPGDAIDSKASEKVKPNDEWERRSRPILDALVIMLSTHAAGALTFYVSTQAQALTLSLDLGYIPGLMLIAAAKIFLLSVSSAWVASQIPPKRSQDVAPLSETLNSLNLCLTSTLISITAVINFSMAALVCVVLGIPLCLWSAVPSDSARIKAIKHKLYLGYTVLVLTAFLTDSTLWGWSVLGVWFAPLICIVYVPLLLQAGLVCIL